MKKILSFILIFVFVIGLTACKNDSQIDKVIKKFNNSETVKSYKEYGYEVKAEKSKNILKITTIVEKKKSTLEFKIDGNVLSNDNISDSDLMQTMILIDSIGQVNGYKEGELVQNINAFSKEIKDYTVEKEGLEISWNDESVSIKIDISKKIPLIDMKQFYLKVSDLDTLTELVKSKEDGNVNSKIGNIAYNVMINDNETTIIVGQEKELSDSAYKSILSIIEVVYGKDRVNNFKELFPKLVNTKTTKEAYTLEPNYKVDEDSVFKDTKAISITIDNQKLK